MPGFIVDETRFMISDDDKEHYFEEGYALPFGIRIGELEDESDCYELYVSEDGTYYILAVKDELHFKWIESGLLLKSDFMDLDVDGVSLHLLFSKTSAKIARLTSLRNDKSCRFAMALYSAFVKTRTIDLESNLRDGIYIERLSVILPTYSLVGKVSDRALFENAVRGKLDPENLSAPDGLNDSLSFVYVKRLLSKKGLNLSKMAPLFEPGAVESGFSFGFEKDVLFTAPVLIRDHYQVYDTSSDSFVLIMDSLWAEALLSTSIINQISLNSLAIDGKKYYTIAIKKDSAIEAMDDRIYGHSKGSAMLLAQAMRRTRALLPSCILSNALYVESLGYLLPETFNCEEKLNDRQTIASVLAYGPFAMAPFMGDENVDIISVATR